MRESVRLTIALCIAVAGLIACASFENGDAKRSVRLYAASSLTDVLQEIITDFETSNPEFRVVPQYGSTSGLARQILAGAPADLFFSADERQMERVASQGWVDARLRVDLLSNRLVVVRPRETARPLHSPDALKELERIAIADPEATPAGVYARQYLEQRHLWLDLRDKVVPTLNVRAALAAAASGNVDAAFVYQTDARIENRVTSVFVVPKENGPKIVYPLAALGSPSSPGGHALFDHLRSDRAKTVYRQFGFEVIETEAPNSAGSRTRSP